MCLANVLGIREIKHVFMSDMLNSNCFECINEENRGPSCSSCNGYAVGSFSFTVMPALTLMLI